MNTAEKISELETKHADQLKKLKEIRDAEIEAEEEKKRLEIKRLKEHGVNDAIKALLALDDDKILEHTDEGLFLVCGDVRGKIEVAEQFESGWTYSRSQNSRGIWYRLNSLDTSNFTGEYRGGQWKVAKSAYKKLKEFHAECIRRAKSEAAGKMQMDAAVKELERRYPTQERNEYNPLILIGENGGSVEFTTCQTDIVKVRRIQNDGKLRDQIAELILGKAK